jgi:hypothetical protein
VSKKVRVTRPLIIDSNFYVVLPNIRLKPSFINGQKQDVANPQELAPFFENTVLHNLVHPEDTVVFQYELQGLDTLELPIPALGSVFDFEARSVYDISGIFMGTSIRLPNIHAGINSVVSAVERGLTPNLNVLYRSFMESLRFVVRERLLSSRIPIGFSAPVMTGDMSISKNEIGVPVELATQFIQNIIINLRRSSHKVGSLRSQYLSMANNLEKRLAEEGPGILSGLKDMVGKREPATSIGTLQRYNLIVIDVPGKACYMATRAIDNAGGDADGDVLYLFNPEDPQGLATYVHLMSSTPVIRKRQVYLLKATNTFKKKELNFPINLQHCYWQDYEEQKMLAELRAKGLIGQCWYILQHYNFLFAHPVPYEKISASNVDLFQKRFEIIQRFVAENPDSLVAKTYENVEKDLGKSGWAFFMFTHLEWSKWTHLCYATMSHAFFNIYELIFDSRKGEQSLSFDLSTMLEELLGSKTEPNWKGMESATIWTEPIQLVFESFPIVNKSRDMRGLITQFPIFEATVTRRNEFGLSDLELLLVQQEEESFCKFFLKGFI